MKPMSPTPASAAAALRDYISARGCEVFEPGTDGYAHSTRIWNGAVQHEPALIARCLTAEDVQLSLTSAQTHGFQVSVRGGGHDWIGRSLRHGGLVLDLSGMRQVSVDAGAKEAMVAGGATAMDVCSAITPYGLSAVTGYTGATTGMTGLILGGGYGALTTRFGLAADSLVAAEVVLAGGQFLRADDSQNADLFWALRGGGGNFGVVTSMRIRLHGISELLAGVIIFPWAQVRSVLHGYAEIMSSAPAELAVTAAISVEGGSPVIALAPVWSGEQKQGEQIISRLQSLGTPILSRIGPATCGEILGRNEARFVAGRHYAVGTRWLRDLAPDAVSALIAAYEARTSPFSLVAIHHFHGAGTRVAADATAFGMREEHFTILIYASWEPSPDGDMHRRWTSDLNAKLAPWALPGGYANLLGPNAHEQISAAYGANARHLRELKQKFDPKNVFSSAIPLPS